MANRVLALKGLGLSLGAIVLMGTGTAIAAPLFPSASQSSQTAQQRPAEDPNTASDDVIVDTESQRPDSTSNGSSSRLAGTRFSCQQNGGQFVVMYHPESQPGQSYPWANPTAMGGGWTPELRCREISRRLESYRPDGLLEMRTAIENGYNIVCVTTQKVPSCRIVLTVPPGQDPIATRDRVFQNLTVADSGQQTQAVNTFVEGNWGSGIVDELGRLINVNLPGLSQRSGYSDAIDLRPFLDRADGGTGTYLRGGTPNRPAPRLNPNRFR
ncbi:COP23 domain-containing protein [Leptothermofonsia sp. ETS-13]|uniref:COP23 domain-containing protein n=1 Tax=Leptothermofonsia sp. ETS-13 TaxID=3035696 RepID=UPI003B9F4BB8